MIRYGRIAKVLVLALVGATLTGCVVLPFGGGHHHGRHDGGRYDAPRGR